MTPNPAAPSAPTAIHSTAATTLFMCGNSNRDSRASHDLDCDDDDQCRDRRDRRVLSVKKRLCDLRDLCVVRPSPNLSSLGRGDPVLLVITVRHRESRELMQLLSLILWNLLV